MMKKIGCVKPMFSQKILPLVYDDSLSYYEANSKLTAKVNEIIENLDDGFESVIREQLEKLFVNIMYDEETKTISFDIGMNE